MSVRFRPARREDVAAVVELLREDAIGASEAPDPDAARAAFDEMAASNNLLIVGEEKGALVATYQIAIITGVSLGADRRAQIEGVRVRSDRRGQGIGAALLADAEKRAHGAGAALVQLTANTVRGDAHRFYARQGFAASHVGFKKAL